MANDMDGILAPWHWAIVIVIILLVFGPKKLPELGNSLGRGITGFRKGLQETHDDLAVHMAEADSGTPIEPVIGADLAATPDATATSGFAAAVATPEPVTEDRLDTQPPLQG